MAFTVITSGEIASAEPVTESMLTKVKDNFDDHESRLQDVEAFTSGSDCIILRVNGPYSLYGALNSVLKTTTSFSATITAARILIDTAGASGTTEIDIKRKRGVGAYETIFSTKPSVGFAAGNDALSSNAVVDGTKDDIEAGDILRLDQTSVQVGGVGYLVRLDFTRG